MKSKFQLLSCLLGAGCFAALSPYAANAENTSLPRYSAELGAGAHFYEMDEEMESGQLYELKMGYRIDDQWSLEGSFGGMPQLKRNYDASVGFELDKDSNWGLKYAVEGQYHIAMDDKTLDPFVALGAGALWYDQHLENDQDTDPFGITGVSLRKFISDSYSVRGDYRLAVVGHDTEFDHQVLFSVGYNWGGSADGSKKGDGKDKDAGADRDALNNGKSLGIVYFAFDSSALNDVGKAKLKEHAQWLKENAGAGVILEGHCDERGTNQYNFALGERRAQAAYNYLRSLGVAPERLSTVSFGEERPAEQGHNEAAWKLNRRVELKQGR